MNRVKAGIFSLTRPAPSDDDGSYLRWHLLDHMPEQFQLPGMLQAHRWIADSDLLDARISSSAEIDVVGNLVNYLVGDPVQRTIDDFMELGRRLGEVGRFPEVRPSLQLRMLALHKWYAAPRADISAEVVPWRPHRGVLLIVEAPGTPDAGEWLRWLHHEHHPALLAVPGVAGVWMYGSTTTWDLPVVARGEPQYVTVVYLDDDPLTVTTSLSRVIGDRWESGAVRPLYSGPFRTMSQWEAWQ